MDREDLNKEAKAVWNEYVKTLKEAFSDIIDVSGERYFAALKLSDNDLCRWIQQKDEETEALKKWLKRPNK